MHTSGQARVRSSIMMHTSGQVKNSIAMHTSGVCTKRQRGSEPKGRAHASESESAPACHVDALSLYQDYLGQNVLRA
eukprot:2325966-Rhodomonas_salina.2